MCVIIAVAEFHGRGCVLAVFCTAVSGFYCQSCNDPCIRLPGDAAPITEWRCSRGRANSVSSCHDDRGAGVSDTHPDFRGRGDLKREDGQEKRWREPNADVWKWIGTTDAERNDQEQHRAELENPDGVKTAEGRRNQEPSEDTLRTRHVPGGAWHTKVRSLLRDRQLFKWEKGGRREEGREGREGVGEGNSGNGQGGEVPKSN
ncbi:hypothetical protein NDU88_003567 [Pleurodeles waltl]|uniref:Uncharacterized protein n=1 Tax=Pleurodeles waltl TaxID=8319 RepID=A0AAV7VI68_PLEWA|nr:hypothetical protein NDU88_003567 [Pleurodeles waltl]